MANVTFRHPIDAFSDALAAGRLTDETAVEHMYMGTWGGADQFKSSITREYLPVPDYSVAAKRLARYVSLDAVYARCASR